MTIIDALNALHNQGYRTVSAATVADIMWPNARHDNAHGQTHNMAAGVAGRILRGCRAVHEINSRQWEIIPEFLS